MLSLQLMMQNSNGSIDIRSLFDPVYILLDADDCMCSSLQEVANNIHNLTSFSCNITDEECTNIQCDVSDSSLRSVGMSVSPCDDPPSLQVNVIVDGETQYILILLMTISPSY